MTDKTSTRWNYCHGIAGHVIRGDRGETVNTSVALFDTKADALLACAAPELLAALEEMVATYWPHNADGTHGDGGSTPSMCVAALAAISRARGEG